jgi:hypothetical protein
VAYRFELVSRDGDILGSFTTSEQRWQAGGELIAHGNQWFRVVSVIPVERMSEFLDEPEYEERLPVGAAVAGAVEGPAGPVRGEHGRSAVPV